MVGRDIDQPTNQSFRVCEVSLATLKVATNIHFNASEESANVVRKLVESATSLCMLFASLKYMANLPEETLDTARETSSEGEHCVAQESGYYRRGKGNLTLIEKERSIQASTLTERNGRSGKLSAVSQRGETRMRDSPREQVIREQTRRMV